jgi:UDP-N-acetylglucosamine 2-epimerase (non-hydrolysing)
VIDVTPRRDEIHHAILRAMDMDCSGVVNPYGDGHAAEKIAGVLKTLSDPKALVKKSFVDRP